MRPLLFVLEIEHWARCTFVARPDVVGFMLLNTAMKITQGATDKK